MLLWFTPTVAAATKALNIRRDSMFFALVVMATIVGWLIAVSTGAGLMLQQAYGQWQLNKQSTQTLYLMPGVTAAQLKTMQAGLAQIAGVKEVARVAEEDIEALLNSANTADDADPISPVALPIVYTIKTTPQFDTAGLRAHIKASFPDAVLEDAQATLAKAATWVRLGQLTVIGIGILFVILSSFIISVTVKAALDGQKSNIKILHYIGAKDSFLEQLVMRQVVGRGLIAWAASVIITLITIGLVVFNFSGLQEYLSSSTILLMLLAPLCVPLITLLAAWHTSKTLIRA